jgi:hypothetical protein
MQWTRNPQAYFSTSPRQARLGFVSSPDSLPYIFYTDWDSEHIKTRFSQFIYSIMSQMTMLSGNPGPAALQSSQSRSSKKLCLLALDGGGVKGLSSLIVLRQLMELIDPEDPPKPCEYFDIIAGTSTGGLIAIMLGRLQMGIDECIEEYQKLSSKVFTHCQHRITWRGKVQGRFDHEALAAGVQDLLVRKQLDKDTLLKDPKNHVGCRT